MPRTHPASTTRRPCSAVILLGMVLTTAGVAGCKAGETPPSITGHPAKVVAPGPPHVMLDMRDISLESGGAGRLRSRIAAGRMSIERKRLGFLRVGGLRQMQLSGVSLDVHLPEPTRSGDFPGHENASLRHPASRQDQGHPLPLLPEWKRGLTEIVADSVSIRVHQGERVISSVRCGRLVADSASAAIRLDGGVEIVQGARHSLARSAFLDLDGLIVRIPGQEPIDLTAEKPADGPPVDTTRYPRGG